MTSQPRLSVSRVSNFTDFSRVYAEAVNGATGQPGLASPRLKPLSAVAEHVIAQGLATVIVQRYIQDPDSLAEYLAYYSRAFANYQRFATRLHFFAGDPDASISDPLDFLDACKAKSIPYLGFVTLRPVASSPVGPTILRQPAGAVVTCTERFPVHIAGVDFEIQGTPYMQQDNAVGACAQAAIWMALRTLRKREGDRAYDPAQITNAATRFLVTGRPMPNRSGLTVEQMMEAIRSAGYAAHVLFFRPPNGPLLDSGGIDHAKRSVYPYILSTIPVVLGTATNDSDGHALMALGFDRSKTKSSSIVDNIVTTTGTVLKAMWNGASWVEQLRIHNDNSGPYLPMPSVSKGKAGYFLEDLFFAMPLLPGDVFLSADEAMASARNLLQFVSEKIIAPIGLQWPSDDLAIQLFLLERFRFRELVLKSNASPTLKRHYRNKVLPKRIWLVEICKADNFSDGVAHERKQIAEILLDPTGDPSDSPFLTIHVNLLELGPAPSGIILDRDPTTRELKVTAVADEVSYGTFSEF